MQYFKNRAEAGKILANKLRPHSKENCVVIALSEGSVLIGAEIAKTLHASLFMLSTRNITLPRELMPLATLSSEGNFSYNRSISPGELEAITSDYRTYIDQQRFEAFQKLNRVVGKDGEIPKKLLKRHTVIIVSDGLNSGLSLDIVSDFLKPINVKKVITVSPITSIGALDRMRLMSDEIYYLGLVENYFTTDHYYEENKIPDHETVVDIMKNIVLNW